MMTAVMRGMTIEDSGEKKKKAAKVGRKIHSEQLGLFSQSSQRV